MNILRSDVILLAHATFGVTGCLAAFAHNLFMETKEHLFFVTAILAFLLPIATREVTDSNAAARGLVPALSGLIVITGLTVEGAGAVINHGVKVALLPTRRLMGGLIAAVGIAGLGLALWFAFV